MFTWNEAKLWKSWLSEFFVEEDGWAGLNSFLTLKSTARYIVAPRSILSPCLHLPIKWKHLFTGLNSCLDWSYFVAPRSILSPCFHLPIKICSPGMLQKWKSRLSEFFVEEDGWAGLNSCLWLKSTARYFVAPRSILSPCLHFSIKWTFVDLEWCKLVKKADLANFLLKRMVGLGKFLVWG